MGRVVKTKVDTILASKLSKLPSDNVLVIDAWRAYKTYAKENKLNDGKHVIKGLYHIQNVNCLHSRIKRWIDHVLKVCLRNTSTTTFLGSCL
jgi:IS1 family transposase